METSIKTEPYEEQRTSWPKIGRHILAHYDDKSIVVYQAFCPEIADYAVKNGAFGGPKYSFSRMTWIKTNFLWMMYRSAWASKKNQDRILAIFVKREGFDEILRCAKEVKAGPRTAKPKKTCPNAGTNERVPGGVRMQWDPDHYPNGEKARRRAVQLGISGKILTRFHEEWILKIEDCTDFVQQQREVLKKGNADNLMTPRERTYVPRDNDICCHIGLDTKPSEVEMVVTKDTATSKENDQGDETATSEETRQVDETSEDTRQVDGTDNLPNEGACCAELLNCQLSNS